MHKTKIRFLLLNQNQEENNIGLTYVSQSLGKVNGSMNVWKKPWMQLKVGQHHLNMLVDIRTNI
jgi:hypothetical protein